MVANSMNVEAHGICLFTANHGPALMVRKINTGFFPSINIITM